jgi:hypothetical protein
MKTKNALCGLAVGVVLHFGVLAGSAQTNIYLFSGSETNITLNPGTYIITAYGARGGFVYLGYDGESPGGGGAEMSAEFNFSTSTTLTLLVGGGGGYGASYGGGGGFGGGGYSGGGGGFGNILGGAAVAADQSLTRLP